MQKWQAEILQNKLNRIDNISKSVEVNIGRSEKQDIVKAQSIEIIENAIIKGECDYLLEKGRKANVGEKRSWGKNEYEKTPSGWKLVSHKGKESKEEGKKEENEDYKKIKNNILLNQHFDKKYGKDWSSKISKEEKEHYDKVAEKSGKEFFNHMDKRNK